MADGAGVPESILPVTEIIYNKYPDWIDLPVKENSYEHLP
jgi:hypothetical protein